MVAHIWANQSRDSARSSNGNFWFSNTTIYSYRTPIARLVLGADGRAAGALRTNRTYSATTSSKHEPAISSALRRDIPAILVPNVGASSDADHRENLDYFTKQIAEGFAKAKRSNARYEYAFEAVRHLVDSANAYLRLFNLSAPEYGLPEDFEAAKEKAAARAHSLSHPDPASADRRERERARRLAREAERQRIAREEMLARRESDVLDWRGGKYVALYHYSLPTMVRVHPGKPEVLQTSRGAEVPLEAAIGIFRLAQRCRDRAEALPASLVAQLATRQRQIGEFHLDRIDADGTIHAGCHTISYEESARLANELGLIDPPPASESKAA